METRQTEHSKDPMPEGVEAADRQTIPASEVGLSLTLGDEALKEFDRVQEDNIKAAENNQNFSWR